MKPGEEITVSDPTGLDHVCRISSVSGECVVADVLSSFKNKTEPPYKAIIYQGMPKGDKTDVIVQKAVELGVYSVVFGVTERSVARPDEASLAKKTQRLYRISEAAAQQSGRGIVPDVSAANGFAEMLQAASRADVSLFCYEGGGDNIADILSSVGTDVREDPRFTVAVVIGPEGGFSQKEADAAREAGLRFCSLGARILRTETAGSHVLSCLAYEFDK
jgi:16S rRNA (uracil1498-N3)-methyltransferase